MMIDDHWEKAVDGEDGGTATLCGAVLGMGESERPLSLLRSLVGYSIA